MKFVKSFLMGTGAVVVAGLILTLLAPKAAHAIVATAVSVVNTTANPASVLDADKATRIPYQSFMSKTNCGSGVQLCQFNFTAAPSGFRLVVENISGALTMTGGAAAPVVYLADASGNATWGFTGATGQAFTNPNSGFNQTVRAYFDPTDGIPVVQVVANFVSTSPQNVILSGYLEDCAVVGCPAIQR
jgi:hypothetical protein